MKTGTLSLREGSYIENFSLKNEAFPSNPRLGRLTYNNERKQLFVGDSNDWSPMNNNILSAYRNKVTNGDFKIWRLGTSFVSSSPGVNASDRWRAWSVSQNFNATKQFDNSLQKNYLRCVLNAPDVGPTNQYCVVTQEFEDVSTLAGKTITVSFKAKANSTKNLAVELAQNFGAGGSGFATGVGQKVVLSTSWQSYSLTFSVPSISGKTIGTNSCFVLYLWLSSASMYNTRSASIGLQTGTIEVTDVQLEEGSVATAFEDRPLSVELEMCNRYVWATDESLSCIGVGAYRTVNVINTYIHFPKEMIFPPTITFSWSDTAGVFRLLTNSFIDSKSGTIGIATYYWGLLFTIPMSPTVGLGGTLYIRGDLGHKISAVCNLL